VIYIAGSDLTE